MTPMATDDNEIHVLRFCHAVDFALGTAKNQILAVRRNTETVGEFGQMRLCLFVNLLLHRRQIHRYVAAIGEAQRFDHVNYVQFGAEGSRQPRAAYCDLLRFFCEINCQENTLIG